MSEVKIKKEQFSNYSLHMALLNLRWQQIRQLELVTDALPQTNKSLSLIHSELHHEKIYSPA